MVSFGFGFRFCPTDAELITYYLKNEIKNQPLPSGSDGVVIRRNIYGDEGTPWILFPDNDPCWQTPVDTLGKVFVDQKVLYVFTKLSGKNKGGKNKNRIAGCGQWHGNSAPQRIEKVGSGELIGKKRTFTFKSKEKTQGHWTMYEYFIDGDCLEGLNNELDTSLVLCRIKRDDSKEGKLVSHTSSRYGVVKSNDQGVIEATKRQLEIDQIGCNKKLRISTSHSSNVQELVESNTSTTSGSCVVNVVSGYVSSCGDDALSVEAYPDVCFDPHELLISLEHSLIEDREQLDGLQQTKSAAELRDSPVVDGAQANMATAEQRVDDAFGVGEERPCFTIVLGDDISSIPIDCDMDGRWEQSYSNPDSFCYVDPAVLPVH